MKNHINNRNKIRMPNIWEETGMEAFGHDIQVYQFFGADDQGEKRKDDDEGDAGQEEGM